MNEKKSILDFKEKEENFGSEHDELITEIVSPYLEKITEDNEREYNEKFYNLAGHKKILIDSLIRKSLFHNEKDSFEKETIRPKDISENKSLRISAEVSKKVFNRELKKIFKKVGDGYIIPNVRIKKIKKEFFENA